ncbi:MAG: glycosyl transferase group 1, partial [Phenylobacterium sp.]|nr:glycosyl transferase group 1 [Phenylobacterium sp.]
IYMIQLPFFETRERGSVTTLHGRLVLMFLAGAYQIWPQFPLVSISDDQRRALPFANWAATVQHGVAAEVYDFSPQGQGYLAFLGRISPEKRPDRAIAIAKRVGMKLRIAAKVDAADRIYFEEKIEPLLHDPLIEFIGEIGDDEKSAFLGGAEALLFPIDWPEPFGLVMIEAMACGAPVVAYACGSVQEVIEDGLTGFIVKDDDQAVAAVRRLPELDRGAIRRRFEERFSATAMARRYLALYDRQAAPARANVGLAAE